MTDASERRRLLLDAAFTAPLPHEPADEVVSGDPTVATVPLGAVGELEVGLWEITAGVVRDTEVDEIFVVLSGAGRVEFDDGEVVPLSPGVVVRLSGGERTTWTVTETLRKIYVA